MRSRIQPFEIAVPDAVLDDLNTRLAGTRWPTPVPGEPWELGADEATLRRLVDRWAGGTSGASTRRA